MRAGRAALAIDHRAAQRARGIREALRQILVTRHAVLVNRTKAINEMKSLIVTAPEHLRAGQREDSLARQLERIDPLTASKQASVEYRVTVLTLDSIAARIQFLTAQVDELDPELVTLLNEHSAGRALLAEHGIGPVVAAQLRISCSHRGRVRSEAAFHSPLWPASRPRRPVAANAHGPASTVAATANSIARLRSQASHRARLTATFADHSNAPSRDASIA